MENADHYQERLIAARGHALMTPELRLALPPLDSIEPDDYDVRAVVKYFSAYGWTWYAFEYDPQRGLFIGQVRGNVAEWGCFSLQELDSEFDGVPLVRREEPYQPLPTRGELIAAGRGGV
jgi:hypothetical protein